VQYAGFYVNLCALLILRIKEEVTMKNHLKNEMERLFREAKPVVDFDRLLLACQPFFEDVNTPVSLALWLMLKYGEYEQYLAYDIVAENYLEPETFRFDYQCVKMFSKAEFFPRIFDTKKEAERKFIACETQCRSVNSRVFDKGFSSLFGRDDERSVIHASIRKIASILGSAPILTDLDCDFGPGLNVGLSNNKSSIVDKLKERPTITSELNDALKVFEVRYPAWDGINLEIIPSGDVCLLNKYDIVPGSRLSFVPKTAKTDRPICVEPLMNSFIQKGIGNVIRQRLRKSRCNLNDQTFNQKLAGIGSRDNSLATVDLSSASDTIAYSVVMNMLPYSWFLLLDVARSPMFTYERKVYPLEKFSSMGNAYTFELETLIFISVARSVCNYLKLPTNQVNAYGDDIIIPAAGYDLLSRTLTSLGFEVNRAKSFSQGPFRESCGADFFLGSQVRPLFLKGLPSASTLMYWCNHLRRIAGKTYGHIVYHRWWASLKSLVPKLLHRLKGPDGQGDGHFVVPLDEYRGNRYHSNRRKGWEGYGFYTIRTSPTVFRDDGSANWAFALYKAQWLRSYGETWPRAWFFLLSHHYKSYDIVVSGTKDPYYPSGWLGYKTQRDRTRVRLTKAFSLWEDTCTW
jgi:hypothetical protein